MLSSTLKFSTLFEPGSSLPQKVLCATNEPDYRMSYLARLMRTSMGWLL